MEVDENTVRRREAELDACDRALADKPYLAQVYDPDWRKAFRERTVKAVNPEYPQPYIAPAWARQDDPYLRPQFQAQVERGLRSIWARLAGTSRNEMIARLREGDTIAVVEELCLLGGFAEEFGDDAIVVPHVKRGERKPEFEVYTALRFAVETRRLADSDQVRDCTKAAVESGTNFWLMASDPHHDLSRLQRGIAKKLCRPQSALPTVLIMTQFSVWPSAPEGSSVVAGLATRPELYGIKAAPALAIAYTYQRVIQGMWFHGPSVTQLGLNDEARRRIRAAVCRAYYPRCDGVLYTEAG